MKQYYSYKEFKTDTNLLREKLIDEDITSILAVARGGLCLAHCLAEGLNIREVQSIRTELYDDDCKREAIEFFGDCNFKHNAKVLVVDDIADSGETFKYVMEYLRKNFKDIKFVTATLFYKKSSIFKPDMYMQETDKWIEFFWEVDFLS